MAVFGPNKPRKIPVPKRHGVRDPLKRLAEREAAIKDKINNPPKERDVQEVSNRFKQFVQLKERTQNNTINQRKRNVKQKQQQQRNSFQVGDSVFNKMPKESSMAFLERASKIQEDRMAEAQFASKYNVDVERNEATGAIKLKKKKVHEIDVLMKKKQEEAKGYKKRAPKEPVKKPSLSEKKSLKKQKLEEKKRKEEDKLLEEYQMDHVEFGEVVHEPPTLNTKPRRAERFDGAPRPGAKRLLLHSLLNQTKEEDEEDRAEKPAKKKSKKNNKQPKVDLKGKRKNLPLATRMKLDREQQNVIEMYRKMKKVK